MSYVSFNKKEIFKSYWDDRTRRLVRVFTVCRFSLGISKSHSRMYLKWTSQKLTSFANSLSLSLSLSLESSFFLPSCKYDRSPFELEVVCTDFIEKKWYRTGGNRTQFDPHLSWNTCICYGHSLLPLLQDWQLQVSGGRGFGVLVNRLLYKHIQFTDAIHKKCCSQSHFAWARLVKAIAVNSLLIVSCS